VLLCTGAGAQRTISINFTGGGGGGVTTSEAASDMAGVVMKGTWNNANGNTGTVNNLMDDTGAVTTTSVSYTSNNTWTIGALPTNATGNQKLMEGYLDSTATSTTSINVTNLPFNTYDVYVYTLGDSGTNTVGGTTYDRMGKYTIGAQSVTTKPKPPFNGTFTLGDNYSLLTGITGASFTLTAQAATANNFRAPVNGIEIVAVPAPGALVTTLMGALPGLGLLLRRRRRVP
jgi:hypothetical protein